jgi:hypothetical protein
MRLFVFFVFLLVPIISFSQVKIRAVVCNSKKEPLPYTNIVSSVTFNGTSTDQNGEFEMENVRINDTIKISNVGYKSKLVSVRVLLNIDTIFLEDNIRALAEVVVRPYKEREVDLGFSKSPNNASFILRPGSQLASYVENKQAEGWIKGVYFKIVNKGKCKNSMRVRILKVDPFNLTPSSDILNENVLINADNLKYNNYVDLDKYNIPFPREGVFVVIEWVYTDQVCDKNSYTVVSANMSINNDIVWFNVRDKHWSHGNRPRLPNGNYMTPNVGLKVAYPY